MTFYNNFGKVLVLRMKNNNIKNKNLAAMYGDPNKVTRGDVIAAAIKNKKKKNTLVG